MQELCKTSVLEQQAESQRHLQVALREQADTCTELMQAQVGAA